MTVYAQPGTDGAKVEFRSRYDNYIGGEWVPPKIWKILRKRHSRHRKSLLRSRSIKRRRR